MEEKKIKWERREKTDTKIKKGWKNGAIKDKRGVKKRDTRI